jgi:hypothetical protein
MSTSACDRRREVDRRASEAGTMPGVQESGYTAKKGGKSG